MSNLFNNRKNKLKKLENKIKELEEKSSILQLIISDQVSSDSNTIDISNVYVVNINNCRYFAYEKSIKADNFIHYINIFNDKEICKYSFKLPSCLLNDPNILSIIPISKMFKELLIYPDGNVPNILLQYLYYKVNDIDSEMLKNITSLSYKKHQ